MSANTINIPLGRATQYVPKDQSGTAIGAVPADADLGTIIQEKGNYYRLVKNGAADIPNAGGKWLVTATNTTKGSGTVAQGGGYDPPLAGKPLGFPTWVVSLPGARLGIGRTQKLAGVVPFPFIGTGNTSTLKANDRFYIQISGYCRAHGNSLCIKKSLRSLNLAFGVNSFGGLTKDSLAVVVKSLNAPFFGQGAFPAYPLFSIAIAQGMNKISLFQQSNVKYSRAVSLSKNSLASLTVPPGAFYIAGLL